MYEGGEPPVALPPDVSKIAGRLTTSLLNNETSITNTYLLNGPVTVSPLRLAVKIGSSDKVGERSLQMGDTTLSVALTTSHLMGR